MRRLVVVAFLILAGSLNLSAQEQNQTLFGDDQQPGNRLHQAIIELIDDGSGELQAINDSIETSLTEQSVWLDGNAKSAVALNTDLASDFYVQMLDLNSLINVTKTLIEENESLVGEIIVLGISLYPSFAQEILNGASMTGLISGEDAFDIALAAGADPTSISPETAAAGSPTPTTPIGNNGGGGSGGGDTTASTN